MKNKYSSYIFVVKILELIIKIILFPEAHICMNLKGSCVHQIAGLNMLSIAYKIGN